MGSRCMILAGSAVHNPVSSHRPKKNSAVTRLPRPPQGIFVCTCTFQGACYLKGPHLERETFLSASFTKENCQCSVHLINVSPFSAPARKSNISLQTCFSLKFSCQMEGCCVFFRFLFKAGPGDQIKSDEVQVSLTRRRQLVQKQFTVQDFILRSAGSRRRQTHRKHIAADANHVHHSLGSLNYRFELKPSEMQYLFISGQKCGSLLVL